MGGEQVDWCKSSPAKHKHGLPESLCLLAARSLGVSARPPRGATVGRSVAFWQLGWSEGGFVASAERLALMRSQKLLLWQRQQSDRAKWVRLSPVQRH